MRIGELADAVGLPARTIRFYERRGLLRKVERAPNGYRVYGESELVRLRFVRSAQAAGLTLAEIGRVIEVRDGGVAPCEHVRGLLDEKLVEVQDRIGQLEVLQGELMRLIEHGGTVDPSECTGGMVCSILED